MKCIYCGGTLVFKGKINRAEYSYQCTVCKQHQRSRKELKESVNVLESYEENIVSVEDL